MYIGVASKRKMSGNKNNIFNFFHQAFISGAGDTDVYLVMARTGDRGN